jgi:hypothetical protein
MMQRISTPRAKDFDSVLVEELKILKQGERRLQQLFPRLRLEPQLRDYFLLELTAVRQRADRLNAVLNPVCIGDLPACCENSTVSPAA